MTLAGRNFNTGLLVCKDLGGVQLINSGFELLFDRRTADFQRGREFSAVDAEFIIEEGQLVDFLECRQILRTACDLSHREIVYLWQVNEFMWVLKSDIVRFSV